jgi:GT2 family glycosyltransferase
MQDTGMHHFAYRQEGVYGATRGDRRKVKEVDLLVVMDKPHGAVLAFDHQMLVKCGYFNEAYGLYGMEHVDWSQRVWDLGLQPPGFWDVAGSDKYFKLHPDASIVTNKSEHLKQARSVFQHRTATRVGPTENSRAPEITYIVPFRNTDRETCIRTVINNVRAQRYPVIYMLMIEQDSKTNIQLETMEPVYHQLVPNPYTNLFNKSQAFNIGVSRTITSKIILHDADMLVQGDYTTHIAIALDTYEACHMGKMVLYADQHSTARICETETVDGSTVCDRIVGYFEGGSLACTKTAYWKAGGFCEDFWGYGVEDCDFYARISNASKWIENRKFDFLHLYHGRAPHWNDHHDENIAKGKRLQSLSIAERIKLQSKRLRELGWPNDILAMTNNPAMDTLDFYCTLEGNRTVKTNK